VVYSSSMQKMLLFLILPAITVAQTPAKVSQPRLVTINCACDDPISIRFGTAVRDQIALSPRYKEIQSGENEKEGHWDINIVALDPEEGTRDAGIRTVLSVVVTRGNYLWTHVAKVCGRDRVDSCASAMIATMDKDIEETQKIFSGILKPAQSSAPR